MALNRARRRRYTTSLASVASLLLSVHATAQSQDSTGASIELRPDRRPATAAVLGTLIPGAGHIYAGEYTHGAILYVATVSGIGGGYMMYVFNRCTFTFTPCRPETAWPHQTIGVLMIAVGVGAWVWSAIDAPRAVHRRLAEREATRRQSLIPPLSAWSPYVAGPATVHRVLIGASATW